jgi:hypothetical protein
MDGRAFLLHRSPDAIAKDAECDPSELAADRYGVFIAADGFNHHYERRGHAAHAYCKHVDAIRGLIADGRLEDPRAAVPEGSFPTPEQVLHDMLVAPF